MNEFDSLFENALPEGPLGDSDTTQVGPEQQEVFERDILQRKHLGEPGDPPRVSDIVTLKRYEVYLEGLRGSSDAITITVDQDGTLSERDQPPENCAWIIVEAADQRAFDDYAALIQPHLEHVIEMEA